jgi:membrane-bound serine protease (ClpP class)
MYVVWAALLLAVGLGLIALEVFIPSGGILGFLAACAVVASVVVAFFSGPQTGVAFLMISVVGMPLVVVAAIKYWPYTPMGRRMLLKGPSGDDVIPRDEHLTALVGRYGTAKSLMLPSGAVTIDGRTVDAISEGMTIERGQPIRVIKVRGNRVFVRSVDPDEVPEDFATDEAPKDEKDDLSRPIESLGLDPFEDPLG